MQHEREVNLLNLITASEYYERKLFSLWSDKTYSVLDLTLRLQKILSFLN